MTTDSPEDDFKAGYGQPPRHSRFSRADQATRAVGRKPSAISEVTCKRPLKTPVRLNEQGKARRVSTQEAALLRLREKALKGDARSLDRLL